MIVLVPVLLYYSYYEADCVLDDCHVCCNDYNYYDDHDYSEEYGIIVMYCCYDV